MKVERFFLGIVFLREMVKSVSCIDWGRGVDFIDGRFNRTS